MTVRQWIICSPLRTVIEPVSIILPIISEAPFSLPEPLFESGDCQGIDGAKKLSRLSLLLLFIGNTPVSVWVSIPEKGAIRQNNSFCLLYHYIIAIATKNSIFCGQK